MRSRVWLTGAVLGVAALLTGCATGKDEVAILKDENAQLRSDRDNKNSALEAAEAARRSMEEENSRLRASASTDGSSPNNAMGNETSTDMRAGGRSPGAAPKVSGMTSRVEGNMVVFEVPGDALFDSGKATLKNDAKKLLDSLAKTMKASYPGKKISVEGFTDTDKITKSKWADNWELAYERARAVGKYLVSKGFSESQFRYVSYGPTDPKSSKKESRRVEIAIVDAN